jgi:probable phosphoglycerate mutase
VSRLLLCRHGESVWNRDGRVQGTAAVPLTDRGRERARALGAHVTSPALREREQGVFQGLSRERAREEYPECFVPRSDRDETFFGRRPPGGESHHDVENRVGAW